MASALPAAEPVALETGFTVRAGQEVTTLDRERGVLASSVALRIENSGDRAIEPPFHVAIRFADARTGEPLGDGIVTPTMDGVLGGVGEAPYGTFWVDLSEAVGEDGLAPGESLPVPLSFERNRDVRVTYAVEVHAVVNRDPALVVGGPYGGATGVAIAFDASGSTDPDGDPVEVTWDFGDGGTEVGASVSRSFDQAGLFEVRVTARDGRGGEVSGTVEVVVVPEGSFALGRTRTLDDAGHPLGGVTVTESGPAGERVFTSGEDSGFASLGGVPGAYLWKFEAPGVLPVWRRATLEEGELAAVPSPWLAPVETASALISLVNETSVGTPDGGVQVRFGPGAFAQPGSVTVAALSGQSLPVPLPSGWSPLAAFRFGSAVSADLPATVTARLAGAPDAGEGVAFAQFREAELDWVIRAIEMPGAGAESVAAELPEPGTWVVVVADRGPTGPPAAGIGEPLSAGAASAGLDGLKAVGAVDPPVTPASRVAEDVTGRASVVFSGAGALASGEWFRTRLRERYRLRGGAELPLPRFDATIFAYQRPGDDDPDTIEGRFPMRPRLLLGGDELDEALLEADVLAPGAAMGGVLTPAGGILAAGAVVLAVPAGALGEVAAGELVALDPEAFQALAGDAGFPVVAAFRLGLPDLADGTRLAIRFSRNLGADADFVLARVVRLSRGFGLEPVERFRSGADGIPASVEPVAGDRLPGVTREGEFVLVRVDGPRGLVAGRAILEADDSPVRGAEVRVAGEPWTTVSRTGGGFRQLAPAGESTVAANDPGTGNAGTATITIDDPAVAVSVDVRLGPVGPSVASVTPAHESTRVPVVTPIAVTFSEPISPASFGATGLAVLDATGQAVTGSLTLGIANLTATFLPTNPLAAGTAHTIVVSDAIVDLQGLPLEGPRTFTFTTATPAARDAGAQLVIFEPGAENVPQDVLDQLVGYRPGIDTSLVVAHGSAGTADPEVPVILVNQATGATATVLSRPDGSFASFVEAAEEDFIEAVFVNANGTRVTVPATKQLFDDGAVGLYRFGGILEAESDGGPVQVIVEPDAVETRTRFRVDTLPLLEVLDLVRGVEPEGGRVLGGVRYEEEIEPITAAADVRFPVRVADLDLPAGTGPEDASFALTIPREINGQIAYQVVDAMDYEPDGAGGGALVTRSPPYVGLLLRQINAMREASGYRDTLNRASTAGFGTASAAFGNVSAVLVPILTAPLLSQTIGGKVVALPEGVSLGADPGMPLSGAFVRFDVGIGAIEGNVAGLFRAGELFAMSDGSGLFGMTLPNSFNRRLVATHPRFPFQRAVSTGIPAGDNAAYVNLVFRIPTVGSIDIDDNVPPLISVSQSPIKPGRGSGEDDGAVLSIVVADDLEIASVAVEAHAFQNVADSQPKPLELVAEPVLIESEESTGGEAGEGEEGAGGAGATARRLVRYRLRAEEVGRATYRIVATDAAGNLAERFHPVVYSTGTVAPDANVVRRLAFAWPPDGSVNVARGTPIRLRFSVPLTAEDLADPNLITLHPPEAFALVEIEPSVDRREVTIRYVETMPDPPVLTLGFAPTSFNQTPGGPPAGAGGDPDPDEDEEPAAAAPDYAIHFAEAGAASVEGELPVSGGGIALSGRYAFAIDRTQNPASGRVLTYRLADGDGGVTWEQIGETEIEGRVMAVEVIPDYALRRFDGTVVPPANYLAVLAGFFDGVKRLHLFRIAPDGALEEGLFGSRPPVSIGISQVVKAKWDAPFLGLHELTPGSDNIKLINLNALFIGFELNNTAPGQVDQLPLNGAPGADLNNDGDFADPGETAPLPAGRGAQVFGLEFSWAPLGGEKIRDFDFNADFGLLGGVFESPGEGNGLVMVLGRGALLDEVTARVSFPEIPKRLLFLPRLAIEIDGAVDVRDLALVSTVGAEIGSSLIAIDVTDPATPTLLGNVPLPPAAGTTNTIVRRDDGLLAVSTTGAGVLLLEPRLLLKTDPSGVTAALVGKVPGLAGGGQRTFVVDPSGIGLSAVGSGIQASIGAPSIRVVRFDESPFDLESLLGGFVGDGGTTAEKIRNVVDRAEPLATGKVFDPQSAASVFDRDAHHYVLIRAPGVLGDSLPLAAASVDGRGIPELPSARNVTPTFLGESVYTSRFVAMTAFNLFKTVKVNQTAAASFLNTALSAAFSAFLEENDKPTYPSDLVARRLSADEASPLFNTYLAGPIVVLDEDLSGETDVVDPESGEPFDTQLDALQSAAERRYLAASSGFWVGLSPTLASNPFVGPWVGQQEEELFADFNAGISLETAFNLTGLGAAIVTANPLALVVAVSQFIDVRLERFIHPGANAFVFVGAQQNPLIFVHGVMASEMSNGNLTDFDLWVPIVETAADLLPGFDTAITDLILPPPGSGQQGANVFPTDVLRDVLGVVDIQGGFLDYVNYELDYGEYEWDHDEVNVDGTRLDGSPNWESLERRPLLFPFPYDWRLDTKLAAERLAEYVELIRAVHPDAERVDIVGHSMGGLVSRRFVIDNPGVVENLVTVASPLLGATKAVASARTGDLGEFALNFLVGIDNSRRIGRYMPALHQLMPSRGLFELGHFPLIEEGWDLDGDGRAFEALSYDDYKAVLDGPHLYREEDPDMPGMDLPPPAPIGTNNEPFHDHQEPGNNIWDWREDSSDTRFFHIAAVQQMPRTISRIRLSPELTAIETPPDVGLAFPPVRFEDSEQVDSSDPILGAPAGDLPLAASSHRLDLAVEIETGAGDGTVPLLSQTRGYGAGPDHDLNHPNAVLTAIISASTDDKDDKAASHVDVLHHPALFDNVRRILFGRLRKTDLPEIQVTATPATEGQTMTFSATVPEATAPSDETPIVIWETGDGRTIRGSLEVQESHVYGDSGTYTLSCCVFYPEAKLGTVESTKIVVGNAAPAEVAVSVSPENPEVGEIVTLTATFEDGGTYDEHTFEWTFGEASEPDAGVPADAFAVRRSFFTPGERSVSVKVIDDHGESATGTATFMVGGGAPAPAVAGPAAVEAPAAVNGDSLPTIALPLEIVEVVIAGHDPEETEAEHDGDDLLEAGPTNLSIASFVLEEQRAIVSEVIGTSVQSLEIFRLPVDSGGDLPGETTIRVVPEAKAVSFDVRYIPPAGSAPRCFHWSIPVTGSESIALTLPWQDLATIAEADLAGLVDEAPEVAKVVPCEAGDEPTVLATLDNDTDTFTFDVADPTVPDGAAITEEDALSPLSVITTIPDGAPVDPTIPDDAPRGAAALAGAIVETYEEARVMVEDVSSAVAIIERDNRQDEIVSTREVPEPARDGGITAEEIAKTKEAIRQAFVAGKNTELFRKFVIDMADVLVFEQGSGACLWKDTALTKCKAYVPGVSDNDYEILLPAMKFGGALAGFVPNPSDPDMMALFREFAHDEQMMEGSWYFKPPAGIDLSGRPMGPIPDYEDHEAYRRYVERAVVWRYELPFGITETLEGPVDGAIEIPKGLAFTFPVTPRPDDDDQSPDPMVATVFDNPATPAEIISFTLTKALEAHRPRREILPDVSFFPFRREHFFFGVPSLEKPPPFGDDPLGDAGMGRGILFLKWAFEGAFVPAFDEFNAVIPDVAADRALRDTIFQRLDQRREEGDFWPESFEWGLFHEFAMLRENALFRMRRVTEDGRPFRNVLPDYTRKHDDKVLKKVGKGGIRAVAAKLFFDDLARADLFDITPSEFDADEELLTFEHWVAKVATSGDHDSLLGNLTEEDVLDLLGAKQAHDGALNRIRRRDGGIEGFIDKTFRFVRDSVQEATAEPYVEHLEDLQTRGRVREWAERFNNAVAIDYGIREPHPTDPNQGDVLRLAGRRQLFGIEAGVKSKYSFIAALQRRGTTGSLGPFSVTLTSDVPEFGMLVCPDLTIPADKETLVIDHQTTDKKPFFTVTEPIIAGGGATYTFTLGGTSADIDTVGSNNKAFFESGYLSVGAPFFAEEFEGAGDLRVVFRGLAITDTERAALMEEELTPGRLLSGSRRLTPERSDDEVAAEMASLLDATVTPGNPFSSGPMGGLLWTEDDLALGEMTPDLKAALYHTAKTNFASVMISTSTTINVALNFAEKNQGGTGDQQRFPYLLMLVVPRGGGIVYAPTSGPGGIGEPYPRWINHLEREIMFKGELRFAEAHLFRITDFPGGVGTVTLRRLEHVASYPPSDD